MDKAMKKKWVKALLSGKYEQGMGYFRDNGHHCCMGVLLEIEHCPIRDRHNLSTQIESLIPDEDIRQKLAELNDDGVPFDMIAGLIHAAL